MENLYNAVLTYKGEGSLTFSLPKYGELTVYKGRDIYVKGLNVSAVEELRKLKSLLLEHKLNGKPDGCYKVIDLTKVSAPIQKFQRAYEPKSAESSVAELKSQMVKNEGLIPADDNSTTNTTEVTPPASTPKVVTPVASRTKSKTVTKIKGRKSNKRNTKK